MKIEVSESTPVQLNWMVAKATGMLDAGRVVVDFEYLAGQDPIRLNPLPDVYYTTGYKPSTNWSQGGPIIEREGISTVRDEGDDYWQAVTDANSGSMFGPGLCGNNFQCGPTPLIAAMRCYVASRLGAEVEIPDELV